MGVKLNNVLNVITFWPKCNNIRCRCDNIRCFDVMLMSSMTDDASNTLLKGLFQD